MIGDQYELRRDVCLTIVTALPTLFGGLTLAGYGEIAELAILPACFVSVSVAVLTAKKKEQPRERRRF